MNATVTEFLAFWRKYGPDIDGTEPSRWLYNAHESTQTALAAESARTLQYIRPIRNAKGLAIGFSPDHIDQVSSLEVKISELEQKLKSICQDIETVVRICGGPEGLRRIESEHHKADNAIKLAERNVEVVQKRQVKRSGHGRMILSELAKLPAIAEAESKLMLARQAHEPKRDELKHRLHDATEICNRYAAYRA